MTVDDLAVLSGARTAGSDTTSTCSLRAAGKPSSAIEELTEFRPTVFGISLRERTVPAQLRSVCPLRPHGVSNGLLQ